MTVAVFLNILKLNFFLYFCILLKLYFRKDSCGLFELLKFDGILAILNYIYVTHAQIASI
jgi:hypothetical protein